MVSIIAGDGLTLVADEDGIVAGSAAAMSDLGDILSYGVTRIPGHGTVEGDAATGAFTYTPSADFFGSDSFDVTVIDGHGGSDTLRVEVTVLPVNDAPRPATADPLTAAGDEEASIIGAVTMSDPENNRMTFGVGEAPKNGHVNIDQNGNYTYTGKKDFFGEDQFTVRVTDAFGAATEVPVTVTVTNVQDTPRFVTGDSTLMAATIGIAANRSFFATDPDGDVVTYHVGSGHPEHGDLGIDPARGNIVYTPEEDYLGFDQFSIEAHDAFGNVSTLTVNVQVSPPAQFLSSLPTTVFFIDPNGNFHVERSSLLFDNYLVEQYSVVPTSGRTSSGTFDLPVGDYVYGTIAGSTASPDGTDDFTFIDHTYEGIDFDSLTTRDLATLTSGGRGFGAEDHGPGIVSAAGSNSILGVTDTGTVTSELVSSAIKPPLVPIEAFDNGSFISVLSIVYPADTIEASYAQYVADYNAGDIFVDSKVSIGGGGTTASFEATRGDVFAEDPALRAFLDQFLGQVLPDDVVTTELAPNAPPTTPYDYSLNVNRSAPDLNLTDRPAITYYSITDRNLPYVIVTPVGGTFQDSDGDGDFDFHGEVEIGLRGTEHQLLRLTDADVQLDPSVVHVTGATVYAAVSEATGLLDPLFRGNFDIDRQTGAILSFSAEAPPEGDSNPYYAPGGLALTYSGFAFDADGVDAFAKMAMPVPFFDGINLDLADLTGLFDQGGFTFAADHYGFAGGSVALGGIEGDFFGLFEMEAEDITLAYDNVTDTFSIDGEIKIKSPVLELIPGAEDPELTFSELKLHGGKFSFDGELGIEELKLPGGFGLKDLTLAATITDNVVTAFSGETHISLGEGKPEPVFGIGFKRPPLSFDKITLGVDKLGVHLGDGVFLEKIQGDLENLASSPPEAAPPNDLPTQFTGTLGFGWGPEIAALQLPEFLGGAEVGGARVANLEVTGTMDFENTFNETVNFNFLSDDLVKTTGTATVDLGKNMFSGLLSYDVLGGIATGQMLTVFNGHGITAHGNQTLTIPSVMDWGPLSGAQSLGADAFLSVSTDAPSQSFFAAWTSLALPIIGSLTVGFKVDAGTGFHLIVGGNDIPKTHSFDVDGTEDWLLITASWENAAPGHVATQVRTPEGAFIQEADYAANGILLLEDLTTPLKTAIVIDDPRGGNWDLQVIEPGVGGVTYHGISPNAAEEFVFGDIVSSPGDTSVVLTGLLAGAPAGSTVSFFYDIDGAGFDGFMIGAGTTGADGSVSAIWNLAGTPRGDYYIYVVAFDGMNAPSMVYADDIVHVALAPTDITINGRTTADYDPDVKVREDAAAGTVVGRLGVLDPDLGSGATFALLDDAGGRLALAGEELVVTAHAFLDAEARGTTGEGGPQVLSPLHVVTVQATDAEGFSITREIEIEVTNVIGDVRYVMGTEDIDGLGGDGNDNVFVGRGGEDFLSGGGGEDVAVFSGLRRNYSITLASDGLGGSEDPPVVIRDLRPGSPDGVDHLFEIEIYRFADGDFTFADLVASPNVTLEIGGIGPIAENAHLGTVVATAAIENPLPGEFYEFVLIESAAGLFRLVGDTILLNGRLDYETAQAHQLVVRATDLIGETYEQTFVVDVSDIPAVTIVGTSGNDTIDATHTASGQPLPSDDGDTIDGRGGNDNIDALDGDDIVRGSAGNDTLRGGDGNDTLIGGLGADLMDGGAGDDRFYFDNALDEVVDSAGIDTLFAGIDCELDAGLAIEYLRASVDTGLTLTGNALDNFIFGRAGNDTLRGGDGNDVLNGKGGADAMDGGAGNDKYHVDDAFDQITDASGVDTVYVSVGYALGAGVTIEYLRAHSGDTGLTLTGNELDNHIYGGGGNDTINGGAGNDVLKGDDGVDRIDGGAGRDILSGGAGADSFVFLSAAETGVGALSDQIRDFEDGVDTIDLSGFGVDFDFIAAASFQGHAGELRAFLAGNNTIVAGDLDGNSVADFQILLTGHHALAESDFQLS